MVKDDVELLDESECSFRMLVEAVQDYSIYMLDPQGRVVTWNSGAERNKGYTAAETIGSHFSRFFLPEDVEAGVPDSILRAARVDGRYAGEGWRVRKDGRRFWASVTVNAIWRADGSLNGFAKVTRDLTERKYQEEALRASEAALQAERDRLRVTLYSIADGVICTDERGNITLLNPVAESLTGSTLASAQGLPFEEVFQIIAHQGDAFVPNPVRECLAQEKPFYLQEGVALLARNGTRREIQDSAAPIRTATGEVIGAILVFQDVTQLRAAEREAEFSAHYDPLTLLPNRAQFETMLKDALQQGQTHGIEHTVCFLDLDRFTVVNDTAGHSAGDVLLRTVADLLYHSIRNSDLVARLGGDEFAIILRGCKEHEATKTLQNIQDSIESLNFFWEGRLFKVTVSIGATSAVPGMDVSTVMKQADVACFTAKHAGRNRIEVYQPNQGVGFERHREIQTAAEIREAIRHDRFSLFAQKIASNAGSEIPRYELLLRMRNRDGSLVSPGTFIPAAERYDLMAEVDRWVLRRVLLDDAAKFRDIAGLQISVNLSANSLNDPRFLPFFLDLIEKSVLPASSLTLEITETALVNNLAAASSVFETLRSIGCQIALDDFGIGVCSFSYLRSFKVDYIKIDGSFVKNMGTSSIDSAIVRAINNIAHEIQARTIAEYVEDEEIHAMVMGLGIDFAQGYSIGRPHPVEVLFQ